MRSAWWLVAILVVVGLFGMLRVSVGAGKQRKPAPPAAAEKLTEKDKDGPTEVDGYGNTDQAARAIALKNAGDVVKVLLRKEVGLKISIPESQIAPGVLQQFGVVQEIDTPTPDPNADNALRARYKVQLTDDYTRAVVKAAREESIAREKVDRQENVVWRQMWLARILGVGVVLLLVVTGYLRLEEATRGYYTQLLRLTAVVLVALAGLGVWLSL